MFFEASASKRGGGRRSGGGDEEQDTFVISEDDVVDAFVARKKDSGVDADDAIASGTQELRGAILSLLMQSDDSGEVSAERSSTFFAAADMAVGALSRAADPPPLGSTRAPVVAIPVVSLVRKLYAPAAELHQSKAHGDCRMGNGSSMQEDLPTLLSELDYTSIRAQTDVQARARRWELMRRFGLPPGAQMRVAVPGTHADVLMRCGTGTLRAARLLGPATGATPAAGRLLFSGDEVAVEGSGMALVSRSQAVAVGRRGFVSVAADGPDALAVYDSPEAAAKALPPASGQLAANAHVLSFRDAALALGRRFLRAPDADGLAGLVAANIAASGGEVRAGENAEEVRSVSATGGSPHVLAVLTELTEIDADGGRDDAPGIQKRLANIQAEIARLERGARPDCELRPLGTSTLGIRGWMRRAADADADAEEVSCAQGHLRTGDAVLSMSRGRPYAFDHVRTAESGELCLTRMRLQMLQADAELLSRPSPSGGEGAGTVIEACLAWLKRPPRHPEAVHEEARDENEFDDDLGMVLAVGDNASYSGGPAAKPGPETSHRADRAGILRDLEKLLGVSPPLALAESAMLLDLMAVLVPPGDGRAAAALRDSIEEVRRRRAELVARYRHRKQPFRVIEAELVRSLRERAAPRIMVEEVSSMSALLAAYLESEDRTRIASAPSSALATVCRISSGSSVPIERLVTCAASAVLSGRIAPDRMPRARDVSQAVAAASAEVRRAGLMGQGRARDNKGRREGTGSGVLWDHFLPAPGSYRADRTLSDVELQLQDTYVTIRMPDGRSSQPVRSCCPKPVEDGRWSSRTYVAQPPASPSLSPAPSDLRARRTDLFAGPAVAGAQDPGLAPVSPPTPQVVPISRDIADDTGDGEGEGLAAMLSRLSPAAMAAFLGSPPGRDPAGALRVASKARLNDAVSDASNDDGTLEFAEMMWSSTVSSDISGIARSFLRHTLCPVLGRAKASLVQLSSTVAPDDIVLPVVEALRSSKSAVQNTDATERFGQAFEVCSVVARNGDDGTCLDAALFAISVLRGGKQSYMLRASATAFSMLAEHIKFNRRDRYAAEAIALQARREQLRRQAAAAAEKMSDEQKDMARELRRLGLSPPPVAVTSDIGDDLDKLGDEPVLPSRSVDASGVFEF